MDRKEIKLWAKEMARNNKWNVWKGYLTLMAVIFVVSCASLIVFTLIYEVTGAGYHYSLTLSELILLIGMFIVYIFLVGCSVSIYRYFKILVTTGIADLSNLKAPITQLFKQGLAMLLMMTVCLLGMMAFVIPGIILILAFAMVPYLLANNWDMKITEGMKTSWQMMKGRKAELVVLYLSFYGWMVLGAFTFGILYIWLIPYMILAFNKFFVVVENQYYGIENELTVNKNDIEEFAKLNNLSIDHCNNVYGMFNDYPVIVMFGKSNSAGLMIDISATGNELQALDEYFENIKTVLTNIDAIDYRDGKIMIRLKFSEELHAVYDVLNRITIKLKDLDFYPGCSLCHLNKPTSFYGYRGKLMNICEDCKTSLMNTTEECAKNISKGVIGALAGALAGGAIWVIVYQLGFIVAFIGYLMVFLAIKGYEMMAGKISKKGLIIAAGCSVLVLLIAEYISIAVEIMQLVSLNNIFNAFSMVPYFLSFGDILMAVIKDVLIGLIFMAVASWQYISRINKSLNEQELKKMD